ncbi:Carbonic anhydrase [Smittium mucronatum]|uniref:Carbonic anhydrase n=1 Tax=Smittium mucronatum TaxID=133383 RepID=A0A1R0GUZ2_9FUNG|nr:Carbonic anhydrase [Smittium mucronatum]
MSVISAAPTNSGASETLGKFEKLQYMNTVFVSQSLAKDPDYFTNLIPGANPSIAYIGCVDPRNAIDIFTESQLGDIYEHRSIAGSVGVNDTNALAAIQFAVEFLQVKDIVLSGHTYCLGIKAVIESYDQLTGPLLPWLAPINELYVNNKQTFDTITDPYLKARLLNEMNVERLVNLVNGLDIVTNARNKGQTINVHGWLFQVENGSFINLNITKSAN